LGGTTGLFFALVPYRDESFDTLRTIILTKGTFIFLPKNIYLALGGIIRS